MKTLILALSFFFALQSQAHEGHHPPTPPAQKPAGCQLWFPAHEICGKINFLQNPQVNVNSPFEVLFLDKNSQPINHDPVFVDLWMNMGHHGHGSSPVTTTSLGEGLYNVDKVFFIMRGPWQVRVTVGHQTSHAETDIFNLNIP